MIRRPIIRRVSYAVASSLLAVMLLGPAGASAATPVVGTTGPTVASPGQVSPGEPVSFGTVSLTNLDSSTISQLALTTDDQSLTVASATSEDGTCALTSPLSCTFRNIKPLQTVSAVVVLNAKSVDFGVLFRWDSTGRAGDKGGNSHGDSFYWPHGDLTTDPGTPIFVDVNGDTTNFRSRYVLTSTHQSVFNDQAVDSANQQATKVVAPVTGIAVTVSDGTFVDCPDGYDCFSEASIIEVAAGGSFPGGFQVILTFDSSLLPSGVNAHTIEILHQSAGYPDETIDTKCTFTDGLPDTMPCLTAKKVNGTDLEVTVWTTHNGFMHGLG